MSEALAPQEEADAVLLRALLDGGALDLAAAREALLEREALREAGADVDLVGGLGARVAPAALARARQARDAHRRVAGLAPLPDDPTLGSATAAQGQERARDLIASAHDPPLVRRLLAAVAGSGETRPSSGRATPPAIEGAAARHRSLSPCGTRPGGFAAGSPIDQHGSTEGASTGGPAPAPPRAGRARVGRFEVLGEVGRGGMGVVLRARDPSLAREVALKVLPARHATREERARFEVEARAVARLRHPHIVAVHEYGEDDDGSPFLAMDLIAGPSLRARLRDSGPLPGPTVARLGEELAGALSCAHAAGVLHRDVKPANVLLGPGERALLVDFGLAKTVGASDGPTSTGDVLGTPSYMAPEQADAGEVGPATDVWGLGATLYEMLTGCPPFGGPTPMATITAVLQQDPTPPSRLVEVDPDLEAVVLACLEKEPARRPPSAEAVGQDLARWRRGEPVQARPAGPLERAWRGIARRPGAVLGGLGVFLALATTGAASWRATERASALEALAEARALARAGRGPADVRPRVDDALARAGRSAPALVAAAAALDACGEVERARALLEEAAAERPREALLELHRLDQRAQARGSRITPALERLIARADATADAERDELALFARAEAARRAGDLRGALAHVDRALELAPRFAWALLERGVIREAQGDRTGALADYEAALTCDPELSIAWLDRGNLRAELGDARGARADYDRALELDPRLAEAWYDRALLRRQAGDLAGAQDDLARAVAVDPTFAQAHLERGALLLAHAQRELAGAQRGAAQRGAAQRGRPDGGAGAPGSDPAPELEAAVAALGSALAHDPSLALAHALRGEARGALGDVDLAIADLDRALLADDGRAATWLERGVLRLALGEAEPAVADLTRALALDPGLAAAWWHRAQAFAALGRPADARRDLDGVLVITPDHVDARLARAALRQPTDPDGARGDLRTALAALAPDDPRAAEIQRALDQR